MTRKEVLENAVKYFKGDDLAANVWVDKYCLRDGDNYIEQDPHYTIERITDEFFRIEQSYPNPMIYGEILELLRDFKYVIPAGSPMFGIGNRYALTSLSNCYVIDSPVDSYGGILKSDEELVQLMKRRGGVGIDISTLRPINSKVSNSAGTSTGAVSFMNRYSNTTREVAQEGRRGALIITMDINHPDIEQFIVAKDDLTKITGANISVKVTDEFMIAVEKDKDFELSFKDTKISINARKLWNKLIHQAWKTAEPGVLFWDRIIEESPADCYPDFKTISTNPCGELPLCAYDSCRLMHVNLFNFVNEPFTENAKFNWERYKLFVYKAQRLMDDMIDLEEEKLRSIISKIKSDPESEKIKYRELELWDNILTKLVNGRRTGLNPWLGLADTLAALNLKYDSNEALEFSEKVAKVGAIEAYRSSITLAKERGSFPIWNYQLEKDNLFLNRIFDEEDPNSNFQLFDDYYCYGRRNISCLTIPPSGSVAIISQVSSGIEPVFNLTYTRKRKVSEDNNNKTFKDKNGDWWEEYHVFHPNFKNYIKIKSKANVYPAEISDDDIKAWIKESPYYLSTTNEIDPIQKVKLQGKMQKYVDHSISITHNLPENIKEEDVSNIYVKAWEYGCKGVTIYREGSRDGILTNKKKIYFIQHDAPKRPKELECNVHYTKSKGEEFCVLVGLVENKPYEVFALKPNGIRPYEEKHKLIKLNKGVYILTTLDWNNKDKGYNFGPITEGLSDEEAAITRLTSTSLRHGAQVKFITEQLDKTEGPLTTFNKAISRVLKKYIPTEVKKGVLCPECQQVLKIEGGCDVCTNCSYSKCS